MNITNSNVLILEDDPNRINLFKRALCGTNYIKITDNAQECIKFLSEQKWDVLFLDHDLGGRVYVKETENTGYEVALWLEEHKDKQPNTIIIHSYNPEGAKRMNQALPNAIQKPGIWLKINQ